MFLAWVHLPCGMSVVRKESGLQVSICAQCGMHDGVRSCPSSPTVCSVIIATSKTPFFTIIKAQDTNVVLRQARNRALGLRALRLAENGPLYVSSSPLQPSGACVLWRLLLRSYQGSAASPSLLAMRVPTHTPGASPGTHVPGGSSIISAVII